MSIIHQDITAFVSPSGNITCLLSAGSAAGQEHARCDIASMSFTAPPRPQSCQGDWGSSLDLDQLARFGCVTDSISGKADVSNGVPSPWVLPPYDKVGVAGDPAAMVLGYGRGLQLGQIRCSSETDGVVCSNLQTGSRFHVSRQSATVDGDGSVVAHDVLDPGALLGTWEGHGRVMTVSATGQVEISYRAYDNCSDGTARPCDAVMGGYLVDGGYTWAQLSSVTAVGGTVVGHGVVVSSADPTQRAGQSEEFVLADDVVTWDGSTFCGPNAPHDQCGA